MIINYPKDSYIYRGSNLLRESKIILLYGLQVVLNMHVCMFHMKMELLGFINY